MGCHARKHLRSDFFGAGNVAANASVILHGNTAVKRQPHILDHHSGAQLNRQNRLHLLRRLTQFARGEWPQGDWTEKPSLHSLRAQLIDGRTQHSSHDAEANQQHIRIFRQIVFVAALQFLGKHVLRLQLAHMRFQRVRLQHDGADHVVSRLRRAFHRPILCRLLKLAQLDLERLHHLANIAVRHDDDRIAIAVRQLERQHGEVKHFLYRRWRQHQVAIAAVAAALHDAEVIALLRSDVSQPRSAAHYVDDHSGQFGAGHVGDTFLHQAEPGARRSRHHPRARGRRAINHVDG